MKKRLIITSALMTCLLGASLATGTYAWYQATAAATVTPVATNAGVGTAASTLSDVNYEVSVTYTANEGKLAAVSLTDPNGGTWAISGGYLRSANATTKYSSTSTTVADYDVKIMNPTTHAELEGADLATALANLKATGTEYNVTATGSANVRMTLTDPSTDFKTAFTSIANKVVIGTLSFATGAPALTLNAAYYSVSGHDDNTVPTDGAEATEDKQEDSQITFGLEVKAA